MFAMAETTTCPFSRTAHTEFMTVHPLVPVTFRTGELDNGHPRLRSVTDSDQLNVCDQTGTVYQHAVRTGSVRITPETATQLDIPLHKLEDIVKSMQDMRLLRPDPGDRDGFIPVDPDVAAATLISPLEGQIHQRRDLIANIRAQLSSLLPMYEQALPNKASGVEVRSLRDRAEVRGALALAATECDDEQLCIRPRGAGWEDTASDDEALARDLAALQRGVRMRVIYQHSARADLTARAYVKRIAAAGAEVRTTNQLPGPFVLFDRKVSFIPEESGGALELSNPAIAQLLYGIFEFVWDSGQPYAATEAGYEGISDDILQDITRLLAAGLTDDAIARRLGLSVRACRRHIARLLRSLDAVSRFQAGTRAASAGIIN